jgi:predicted PurR-regulated permease PerM
MGTAIALALKPLVAAVFGYLVLRPAVRRVQRMKDGRVKRLLLRRVAED